MQAGISDAYMYSGVDHLVIHKQNAMLLSRSLYQHQLYHMSVTRHSKLVMHGFTTPSQVYFTWLWCTLCASLTLLCLQSAPRTKLRNWTPYDGMLCDSWLWFFGLLCKLQPLLIDAASLMLHHCVAAFTQMLCVGWNWLSCMIRQETTLHKLEVQMIAPLSHSNFQKIQTWSVMCTPGALWSELYTRGAVKPAIHTQSPHKKHSGRMSWSCKTVSFKND